MPWLVWLCGLGVGLETKRLPVQFPVRAYAWVVGQAPGWRHARGNQSMFLWYIDVSLSLFLPLSLKINIIFKKINIYKKINMWKEKPCMWIDWKAWCYRKCRIFPNWFIYSRQFHGKSRKCVWIYVWKLTKWL